MSRIAQWSGWARYLAVAAVAAGLVAVGSGRAAAQAAPSSQDYFTEQKSNRLTYRVEGERTRTAKIALWSMAGATLVTGGLGVVFNLQSRDAANDVRALTGEHTGLVYTRELDQRRQDAETYGTVATVFYAVGGALALGTIVTFIVTSPPDRLEEYKSGADSRVAGPYVVPVDGGAVLGAGWSF